MFDIPEYFWWWIDPTGDVNFVYSWGHQRNLICTAMADSVHRPTCLPSVAATQADYISFHWVCDGKSEFHLLTQFMIMMDGPLLEHLCHVRNFYLHFVIMYDHDEWISSSSMTVV